VTRLWCELAWLGGERAEPGVLLEVEGERLRGVDAGVEAPEDAERLPGLTLPGLASRVDLGARVAEIWPNVSAYTAEVIWPNLPIDEVIWPNQPLDDLGQ